MVEKVIFLYCELSLWHCLNFYITLQLMMKNHHHKFGYKRLSNNISSKKHTHTHMDAQTRSSRWFRHTPTATPTPTSLWTGGIQKKRNGNFLCEYIINIIQRYTTFSINCFMLLEWSWNVVKVTEWVKVCQSVLLLCKCWQALHII